MTARPSDILDRLLGLEQGDEVKVEAATEIARLRTALRAVYDRYCSDPDGWSIEPECHVLARQALGLPE